MTMTEQDKINSETQMKLALQDAKFAIFMQELKEQREDIRRLQDRQDAMQAKIDSKFDKLSEQLHTMTIAAVVGFGAIAVAMAGVVVSVLK